MKYYTIYKTEGALGSRIIHRGYLLGFLAIASLFFLWAVANNLNDILIRQFQKALDLSRGQSGFIQFVFYLGYFLAALPAGLLLKRIGYRKGIIAGLCAYALGAFLFFPAAEIRVYSAFLAALFVIAIGVATLETAANPYIARFGPSEKAAQRLNLAQAFNGFGAFVAPLLGGLFIFSGVELDADQIAQMSAAEVDQFRAAEAAMVQVPYLILGGIVLLVAFMIMLVRLPKVEDRGDPTIVSEYDTKNSPLLIPHLRWAVVSQFFYVGAQVVIWSYFIDYTIDIMPDVSEKSAALFLSASLAAFMIGRFVGTGLLSFVSGHMLLLGCACAAAVLCLGAIFLAGFAAVFCLAATSFFMSIMFPTIFALGLDGAGRHTKLGSSFLIMAIIGGALFPPVGGYVADITSNIQLMAILPLASFVVIAGFAWRYEAIRHP